jgi:hypothetical protein
MDVKRRIGVRICALQCLQVAVILYAVAFSGCQRHFLRNQQCPPATGFCGEDASSVVLFHGTSGAPDALDSAAASLADAERLAAAQDAECVDRYYWATLQSWRHLEAATMPPCDNPDYQRDWKIYQQSLDDSTQGDDCSFRLEEAGGLFPSNTTASPGNRPISAN